jgi:hypothetical protein
LKFADGLEAVPKEQSELRRTADVKVDLRRFGGSNGFVDRSLGVLYSEIGVVVGENRLFVEEVQLWKSGQSPPFEI